jgi:hypothetical protein
MKKAGQSTTGALYWVRVDVSSEAVKRMLMEP